MVHENTAYPGSCCRHCSDGREVWKEYELFAAGATMTEGPQLTLQDSARIVKANPVIGDLEAAQAIYALYRLPFDDSIRFNCLQRDMTVIDPDEQGKTKRIDIVADGQLYDIVEDITEHLDEITDNRTWRRYSARYYMFLYGYRQISAEIGNDLKQINDDWRVIRHSGNSRIKRLARTSVVHPLPYGDKAKRIEFYLQDFMKDNIDRMASALTNIDTPRLPVVFIWYSALSSSAYIDTDTRQHGESILKEFYERVQDRKRMLERLRADLL